MAIIGLDHFTDINGTQILSHIPDVGSNWVRYGGAPPSAAVSIWSNQLAYNEGIAPPDIPSIYYLNTALIEDCSVQAKYLNDTGLVVALLARIGLGFIFLGPVAHGTWFLSDGTNMQTFSFSFIPNLIVKLVVQGSIATAFMNGVQKAQITTNIVSPGNFGIFIFSQGV